MLVFDDPALGEVLVPQTALKGYAKEGDVIKLTLDKDDSETERRRERVASLLQDLLGDGN